MKPLVIVSRPSILSDEQEQMCHRWTLSLRARGLETDHLPRSRYELNRWDQLQWFIKRADGLLVLGFSQLVIESGVWRLGTPEEVKAVEAWTSPWMQIEAGMAIMAGVPVLSVPQQGIAEGVFAPDTWTGHLFGVPADAGLSRGVPDAWVAAVLVHFDSRRAAQVRTPPDMTNHT